MSSIKQLLNYVKEKAEKAWQKMGDTGNEDYQETATNDEIFEFGYYCAMENVIDFLDTVKEKD
ncbi:MAG: hypothetical protein ACTSYW_00545 [Candidatus Heimdallarchaeota archaeon]